MSINYKDGIFYFIIAGKPGILHLRGVKGVVVTDNDGVAKVLRRRLAAIEPDTKLLWTKDVETLHQIFVVKMETPVFHLIRSMDDNDNMRIITYKLNAH